MLHFYIDDSGTRHPDKPSATPTGHPDWFALGGVLIKKQDEIVAREMYEDFCDQWKITYPLHSSDIRHKSGKFAWLQEAARHQAFMASLTDFLTNLPVLGLACIIDRHGYNARYAQQYERARWQLCKTAFSIAVERATKFAANNNYRLRVLVEGSSREDETKLKTYYHELREKGLPFNATTSAKYSPLGQDVLHKTLYEFKVKQKSSPLMQVADMYLYPMCQGGYDSTHRPYQTLRQKGKLLDCVVSAAEAEQCGIKYSCFDDLSYIDRLEKKQKLG